MVRFYLTNFSLSVVFHSETNIWSALQIMRGFYMECYTGLKLVKREYSLRQILNLSIAKMFRRTFWCRLTNDEDELFHDGDRYHIETSPLICKANQWTGFYKITASNMKELRNIQHSMSMVLTTRFHIWFIIKLYYKMRQILSINATAFLL